MEIVFLFIDNYVLVPAIIRFIHLLGEKLNYTQSVKISEFLQRKEWYRDIFSQPWRN